MFIIYSPKGKANYSFKDYSHMYMLVTFQRRNKLDEGNLILFFNLLIQ